LQGTARRNATADGNCCHYRFSSGQDEEREDQCRSLLGEIGRGWSEVVQQMETRFDKAIVRMLATASEPLITDPQIVAAVLQGAMAGVGRKLLESSSPEKKFGTLRRELILMAWLMPGCLFGARHR
jgi:hypothetical protein